MIRAVGAAAALIVAFGSGGAVPGAAQEMERSVFHYSQLEVDAAHTSGPTVGRWHASGWIGTDFDRLWWSTEGEGFESALDRAEATLLYGHYFRRFWDVVVGYRHDFAPTHQGYLTVGLVGLAPYWFEVGVFGFLSDRGRPSLRLEAETDLYLTQRWILTPGGEIDWLLMSDSERDLDAGFDDVELGLRTRYEIRRKFAPYVEAVWVREKAPRSASEGHVETSGFRVGAGLRFIY